MVSKEIQEVEWEDARVGEVYDVDMDDCCVKGSFRARLTHKPQPENVEGEDYAEFDNGVRLSEYLRAFLYRPTD